jgi:hypothetical protein
MVECPGLGEWPPLRTENFERKKRMAFKVRDTSAFVSGKTTHLGVSQAVWDLEEC